MSLDYLAATGYKVGIWHGSAQGGEGQPREPDEILMLIDVEGVPYPVALPFETPEELDLFLTKLTTFRYILWPDIPTTQEANA